MRVGITGHQRLDHPETWLWVADVMRGQLSTLLPPLLGITSLAIGSDQLFARLVLELGGRIHAVLPFADIDRSFSPGAMESYRDLVKQASIEVLDTPGTDEDAYLAAGRRVTDLSDIMLAIWDGMPAKGRGGTADIVAYAIEQKVHLIQINPMLHTIQELGRA